MKIKLQVQEELHDIKFSVGDVIEIPTTPMFDGDYELTPKAHDEQTLECKGLTMRENVTVHKVPYWETGNLSNGYTAYIAQEG